MEMTAKKLTDKQARFVDEYLVDLNATQACIRAGYKVTNADKMGWELLGKTLVSEAIQKGKKALAKKAEFSQETARDMYMMSYKTAKDQGIPSVMVSATTGLCKLYGVNEPDKTDMSIKGGGIPVTVIRRKYVKEK